MSCLDVMFPAYGHYTPYAPTASAFISSLPAPVGVRSPSPCSREFMESVGTSRCTDSTSAGAPAPPSSSSSSSYTAASPAEDGPKEKREIPEAEYLNSRCVLFTYYQGDISSVVDEHFSRALSAYMEGEGKRRAAEAASPINRRSFPPSFWDSNYPSPPTRGHCDPGAYSMDHYAHGALHPGLPHPHAHPHPHSHPHAHPSESWSYSQSQAYGPPRPLHELYSPSGLDPHYGPLLMPAVRPPHLGPLPGHYEVGKLEHTTTWPGLLPASDVAQTLALNMDPGLQHQKKGKELYWF
ncbi:transcription cofactor vestigial-like protein 2b [Clupea harengus]|uniref:Transcription cofactor vestigial-like protein 2b n=1 Tax=Clupea harengus TaxID=7950 RepID=A0A6P8GMJ5_CLUHA|nr:transcription cofactor vestigial-like protein 2b [Clupea harengus]